MHTLGSCIEIMISIPLAAHTTVTMNARRNMSYFGPFEGSHSSGPVLFRGRLRAFGKCTNGVASSKGRQNL